MKVNTLYNGMNNINKVDLSSLNASANVEKKEAASKEVTKVAKDSFERISLTGSDLNASSVNQIYNKESVKAAAVSPLSPKERVVEDFSLDAASPVRATNIKEVDNIDKAQASDNKVVISDKQMDDFLHKAFNLFDLDY